LPKQITKTGGGGGSLEFTYDASGRKWKKEGAGGKREYVLGIEYHDAKQESIFGPDGRIVAMYDENGVGVDHFRPEYWHTDHLGNVRLAFSDVNNNGRIEIEDDPGTPEDDTEVMQENHYYPFGMNQLGPWYETVAPENKYQYNGKELNEELGLDWYDYGARWYDGAVGRWGQVDPLAEPQISWSTYHYVYNNPLKFFDPFGLMGRMAGADGLTNEQWIESSRPGADPNAARRYRNENRLAEANLSRFHSWFDDTYVWNPYAGEEIGRETLGGALRLSFSGGYTLRQGGYLPRLSSVSDISSGIPISKAQFYTPSSYTFGAEILNIIPGIKYHQSYRGVPVFEATFTNGGAVTLPPIGIFVAPGDGNDLDLLRHEHGHWIQYRLNIAPSIFYLKYGMPSLISAIFSKTAIDHQNSHSEKLANTLEYWSLGRPLNWNFYDYPVYIK
jgi:RHS repeat-associated protein